MVDADRVVAVLTDVLAIVESAPQDVTWTATWAEAEDMVADLHDHLARLQRADTGRLPELRFLFLPTGPLQEVSLSSGWAERYLPLAARFDAATA